jgi:hypothetical protein
MTWHNILVILMLLMPVAATTNFSGFLQTRRVVT